MKCIPKTVNAFTTRIHRLQAFGACIPDWEYQYHPTRWWEGHPLSAQRHEEEHSLLRRTVHLPEPRRADSLLYPASRNRVETRRCHQKINLCSSGVILGTSPSFFVDIAYLLDSQGPLLFLKEQGRDTTSSSEKQPVVVTGNPGYIPRFLIWVWRVVLPQGLDSLLYPSLTSKVGT